MIDGFTPVRGQGTPPHPPLLHVSGLEANFLSTTGEGSIRALSKESCIELQSQSGAHLETISLSGDPAADMGELTARLPAPRCSKVSLDIEPRVVLSRYTDILLAMFVQRHFGTLHLGGSGLAGDIVLAHAIPLSAAESQLWSTVLSSAHEVADCDQLVVLARTDLILADPSQVSREYLLRRHNRLLRRNGDLACRESVTPGDVPARWVTFVEARFNESPHRRLQGFMASMFSGTAFSAHEYRVGSVWVASSLVYRDRSRNILFDVLGPWNPDHARRRPGMFTAVRNLLAARSEGLRYSLCYGHFPYKSSIVRGVPEVDL